jgi:adenylate kinase
MNNSETAVSSATERRNVIILLGGPGAGKGTQAQAITGWLRIPHISTGELLRSEIVAGTGLGLRARAVMETGALVGDDLVNELVASRVSKEDCNTGFVLDGYPRSVRQAVALESSLPLKDRQIVIDIAIDLEKIVPRLTARRTCAACRKIYHLTTAPPLRPGVCDRCNARLIQRFDDREDVIRERFKAYTGCTRPLTGFYRRMGIYHQVDGMGSAAQVAQDIRSVLEREIRIAARANSIALVGGQTAPAVMKRWRSYESTNRL